MSTTNVQLDLSGQQQETEEEEYFRRTKAEQQEQLSRKRGGTGASRSLAENSIQGRRCARCGGAFGRFYNTGASCPRCRHRVCRQCREFRGSNGANNKGEQQGADWLCAVCHKIAELRSATGDWIYETATLTSPRFVVAKKNSPVDIIKRSIRRAWTINGPPARWSISRKSPAFRIYRSLPIREKIHNRNVDEDYIDESSFLELPQATVTSTIHNDDNPRVIHRHSVENIVVTERSKANHVEDNFHEERRSDSVDVKIVKNSKSATSQSSTKNEINIEKKHDNLQLDETTSSESNKRRKNERDTTNERGKIESIDVSPAQETLQPRVSLIKPPRIITRIGNNENKQTPKYGDRKSNIPIFRRNSREFEDIGSPQETAKRSLIPQRYRGSTDDLRRSREDISIPSHIPKLFSPRNKDPEKLKRQDSRDDIRQSSKGNRRESPRQEENRTTYFSTSYSREDQKSGIRIFRRDSREDVGRETTSLPSLCVVRAQKTACKDEKHDRNEVERVGDTITRSKSCPSEQGKTRTFAKENSNVAETKNSELLSSKQENFVTDESPGKDQAIGGLPGMANEQTMMEEPLDIISNAKPVTDCQDDVDNIEQNRKISDEEIERKIKNLKIVESTVIETPSTNEFIEPILENTEIIVDRSSCRETDIASANIGEKKSNDSLYSKKVDDVQVIRRKFSKEEFSNPDDTDEAANRRSSSHLSPEASPLSTRSSRYSPRESESEPTPALPRKIGNGDSCSASQRIRDAITRTRRESNSSARYESSGSESVRLSESGLNSYADLARRVKLFGSGGNDPGPSLGNDEPIQRDSATSAGEDEPHEDCHSRGPGSSQGRTMLRRRRQFDAQGSRRRGRSHARTCCGEELQNLQALHVLGRGGGRQSSPTQCQETQNPDYRRLVFISSDSSSGREEDDADSSCSGSSYLNGLPRNNHAQSLEDCDWDYFESGTLPLPGGIPDSSLNVDNALSRDWSCCPGRGSAACLACGGSPGTNVLPVPVPIPVPVPYPVPVPASLWTGDFAAAASSMITRGATPEGTLRLRGDPSAPWFSWHPRFNQPLNDARIDSKSSIGAFDPRAFGFKPEEITPKIYSPTVEETLTLSADPLVPTAANLVENSVDQRAKDCQNVQQSSTESNVSEEPKNPETLNEILKVDRPITEDKQIPEVIEATTNLPEKFDETSAQARISSTEQSIDATEDSSAESSSSRGNNKNNKNEEEEEEEDDDEDEEQSMYRHSRENSASSSGRSSADSSDLEDSASHRFSRVFVVNDDSLTSDNEIEENEDSDSPRETLVKLKRVTSLAEVEPVVLRRVRLLDEDMTLPRESADLDNSSEHNVERRSSRIEQKLDLLAEQDQDANEIYLASSTDFSENKIQLKSIKNLNPDDEESYTVNEVDDPIISPEVNISDQFQEENNWDSVITPDSLEIVETTGFDNSIKRDNESLKRDISSNCHVQTGVRSCVEEVEIPFKEFPINKDDSPVIIKDNVSLLSKNASLEESESEKIDQTVVEVGKIETNVESQNSSSTTDSSEINTTGSEISSDELHEYEISSIKNDLHIPVSRQSPSQSKSLTDDEKSIAGKSLKPVTALPRKIFRIESESSSLNSEIIVDQSPLHVSTSKKESPSPVVPPRPQKASAESMKSQEICRTDEKLIFIDGKGGACEPDTHAPTRNVGDIISSKIQEIFKNSGSRKEEDERIVESIGRSRDESIAVRGEKLEVSQVGGVSEVVGSECGGGNNEWLSDERGKASTRFRSVERRTPTRKENGGCFSPTSTTTREQQQQHQQQTRAATSNFPSSNNNNSNNKYRSLVMITQGAYQPVSVITSDTTTLLQPNENESQSSRGLAGYFHLALESVNDTTPPRNGQPPRRPLMVKRSITTERDIETKTSVEISSENEDVLKNFSRISSNDTCEQSNSSKIIVDRNSLSQNDQQLSPRSKVPNSLAQTTEECSTSSGLVILEEGLADDDSWVEEVSHDEDEQSVTTATEESSEDEANNLGDREEELRGYHRQAIDFTLHTIVEESCEESEAEPSLATNSPRKKRPPSASELEKYFFFGLGGENNVTATSSREIDSLSETSSIYSEGLESLGQDETNTTNNLDNANKGSNEFLNSSRLEKYFLSEFLGFGQDRRDSDGSVGSDSEGRPSPEAQRRKRLVRARGTGRSSHSSSLDNLLALAQGSQNLSLQNSLQDLSLAQDSQETLSEGSSTETDGADEAGQTPAFGTDGQFDTVKRKKKKPRNLGTQSPRVTDDRSKTPEPKETIVVDVPAENENETIHSDDDRAKTPQPESSLHSSSSSSSHNDGARSSQASSSDTSSSRGKQASRDSGFVGSCDDLLQHQKSSNNDGQSHDTHSEKDSHFRPERTHRGGSHENDRRRAKSELHHGPSNLQPPPNASLSRKDSFNNWSSDEETNLMMSKMRQFFKTMVASMNSPVAASNSSGPSPAPSPRLAGYSRVKTCSQNRTKPPQLVYFENELTRLMKTVPGIRDEQVREIVEYLSSEDTWSDSYDSSDYTSSDLEGAAGGRRSALQEQISQSCQQIINKFDTNLGEPITAISPATTTTTGISTSAERTREEIPSVTTAQQQQPCLGRDTAFVYQKLVQSFTKIAADGPSSDTNSTPHSSPPLIAKVMHHIGSRLVALMHEVSEGGPTVQPHATWRRYAQHHHRTPSSASTTEDDDSTSDSTNPPSSSHLPRSKSHDPLLLINGHPATSGGQEGEEREASDYERFSWRGSFESALMAADSRTKLSLLACSGDVSASASASALAMAAKRRSAGDLLFNPKSFSREQLDRVRSCGSIGGGTGGVSGSGGSIEEKIWSNRRRSSVPDANTRGESGASAGDDDTEDELEYGGDPRATTLPRGMQAANAASATTNSLPRLPVSTNSSGGVTTTVNPTAPMHKAHSVYHFLPQHTGVKSARYRPPGFARNSLGNAGANSGPKRAVSAPGLQVSGSQTTSGKRENSRTRRQQQAISLTPDDGSSLSEACSTPIIGAGSRAISSNAVTDIDDMDRGLHTGHPATRASLSSLGARSDSMASVYSGAGEGRWCGSVAVRGEVEFSLQYDYKQLTFEVHVTQCKDLAPVDVKRNRSDPYVKVYLLPDKSKSGKRKTKVKKHTLNPVFDETLKFHMSLNGLETRILWLTVWHSDMFGRNDFLGEVRMPLENKIFDDPTPRWYPLQERTEPFDDPVSYKGEVIVGLKFVPPDPAQLEREREMSAENRGLSKGRKNWSRGSLHVLVKEARNLQTRAKNSGTCDPFCKSYLLPDKGRSGKQKTGVVRRSGGSPVWGHTFVYKDVSLQELAERGLELTVWDHDRIASNEFLGGVRFNLGSGKHYGKIVDWMDATGRELSLWQSMLERPNFWVEGAVTLRPNLHNHVKGSGT